MKWLHDSPIFSYGLIGVEVVMGILQKYDAAACYAAIAIWLLLHWDIYHE